MSKEFNLPHDDNAAIADAVKVWIAKKIGVQQYAPFRNVGAVTDGNLVQTIEELKRKTNLFGIDSVSRTIITSTEVDFNITVDEIVKETLSYLIGSSILTSGQKVVHPELEVKTFNQSDEIILNGGQPIVSVIEVYPLRGDVYEEGPSADYTVDLPTGKITRGAAGNISAGETVNVSYEVEVNEVTEYNIQEDTNIRGKIIIADLGNEGPKRVIKLPESKITVDGDINVLNKTDVVTATLKFSVKKDPEEGFGSWYQWTA